MAARCFRTYSGKQVHPLSPSKDEIDIEDVAHALSRMCRFLGHTESLYTVAQHSILVSHHVPVEDALWGLLHDASEAYLGDLPAPIKRDRRMRIYRVVENRLMRAVCDKFGLPRKMPRSVKIADKAVLATEFRDVTTVDDLDWIIGECGVKPLPNLFIAAWPPIAAEATFIARFKELTK